MLSLLLTLSLGQASVSPRLTSPPLGFDAPPLPIRIEGAPSLVRLNPTTVAALWLDRRRGLDQVDAGLDVWAGSYDLTTGALSAALLTPDARRCTLPRLVSEPANGLFAAWACVAPDGGGFVESATAPTGTFSQLPPTTLLMQVGPPIVELAAAASSSTTMVVARRGVSFTVLTTRPALSSVAQAGSFGVSLVETPDSGISVLLVDSMGAVTSYHPVTGHNATLLATGVTSAIGLAGQPEWTFGYQDGAREVRRRLADGGVSSFGTNGLTLAPLISQAGSNAVAVYRGNGNSGIDLRLLDGTANARGTTTPDAGIPLAITPGTSPVIAELFRGEVVLRETNLSGPAPGLGAVHRAFLAPAPQTSPAVIWSPFDGFTTLWDQRTATGWETLAGAVDTGGSMFLFPVGSDTTPAQPSVATGADGGQYVALNTSSGRSLYQLVAASRGSLISPSALDEIAVGESSFFTWSPISNLGRHSAWMMPRVIDPVRPGCIAWWRGVYWYAPPTGSSLVGWSEDGGSATTTATLPSPPMASQRCLTIGETGAMRLTITMPDGVEVYDLDAGILLAPRATLSSIIEPSIVGVGDGVVAVVATVPDGGQPTIHWVYAGPRISTVNFLSNDTQPVRNLRAAKSAQGDVVAAWETFDLDAGTWRVQMRIIQGPYPTGEDGGLDAGVGDAGIPDAGAAPDAGPPDAGPPDAGPPDAGPPDAGPPDAGPPDAGPPDAGPPDAGPPDAGPPDAGPVDAGAVDAGAVDAGLGDAGVTMDGGMEQQPIFVPVCGCSGTGTLPSLLFGLLLLLRRARGVS